MMRVRVLLTLVLIAALLWESEARFSRRYRNRYSRRYRRTQPTSRCSNPWRGRGVLQTGCLKPYQAGETCGFSCQDGYRQTSGDNSRTCSGGSWSGQPLVCEYAGCYRPPYTEGSWWRGCSWPFETGESCTYECRDGHVAVSGDSSITCQDGAWSGTPLSCEYTGCERPPFTRGSWSENCWWPYENGENCTYTCREGYSRVSGDSTITCVDRTWSGTPLECQRTSGCDAPPRRYGSWGPRDCRWPYEEGETCRFDCRPGWEQQSGNTTTTCTGGQWTGDPLVCTRSSSPGSSAGWWNGR
ncbi:sushi, von Willebrand factor type A, EGF and pentraxin domain-containing protein 1-like isoform X2 [Branchiostoma floridae]|uniref:Sushi, von Willebrand factor type A, EGF and pentraxin domain-containing protein 1-like isoform X2 n=1 Tax=Branchiostoma floridae TaxID=7739 RepID=A0A9J7MH50_BRAFL|nr:sushi, von Willebrand factor type A, EGF and pentraxin domain-containing protein 1-like isoform X2 [Branchiostoma floridae]